MNNYDDVIETIPLSGGNTIELRHDAIPAYNSINNLCAYIIIIKDYKTLNQGAHIFYRGQAKEWRLMPKVFRSEKVSSDRYSFNELEKNYYYEALTRFPEEFAGLTSLDKLAKMQHYGWPTRMLDVTINPLAALWFACSDNEHKDEDGFVYIFKTNIVLPYDSDRALMLACLPRFDAEERKCLYDIAESILITEMQKKYSNKTTMFNWVQVIQSDIDVEITEKQTKNWEKDTKKVWDKYLYEITRERSAFLNYHTNPKDMLSAYFVRPQMQNLRIKNQDGAFVIFGLKEDSKVFTASNKEFDKDIEVKNNIEIFSVRIPKENKKAILEELDLLNINKSTLFQDMENTANYIKSKYDTKASK